MKTSLLPSSFIQFTIYTKQSLPTLTLEFMGVDAISLTEWGWAPNPPAADLGLVLYPSNPPVRNDRCLNHQRFQYNALQYYIMLRASTGSV